MDEMDGFERRAADTLAWYADDVSPAVDAAAVARRVALEHPRRGARALPWVRVAIPRVAWLLLLAGMLVGLVVGGLVGGTWRPDHAGVVVPSPSPTPAATDITAETDVLAMTRARALPAHATCPEGSDPDALGPADQERPAALRPGSMAFDRRAGRIVLLAGEYQPAQNTWTFDVCTNTWQRMHPAEEPPSPTDFAPIQLVYDADSDRTLAVTSTGVVWTYDLAADRWTVGTRLLEASGLYRTSGGFEWNGGVAAFYHDPSGLVVLYNGETMWAYDVDTDTLAKIRQRPDPSRPAGSGTPHAGVFGSISVGYDTLNDLIVAHVVPEDGMQGQPATWSFDPGTGTWRQETSATTPVLKLVSGWIWPEVGTRAVFDAASGLTLFQDAPGARLEAYDAARRAWRTLYRSDGEAPGYVAWCDSMPPVYDPLNARVVCHGVVGIESGLSTFSTATGQWRWLLEPLSRTRPSP